MTEAQLKKASELGLSNGTAAEPCFGIFETGVGIFDPMFPIFHSSGCNHCSV
jgi:hypothetical protein